MFVYHFHIFLDILHKDFEVEQFFDLLHYIIYEIDFVFHLYLLVMFDKDIELVEDHLYQ
jgi:hypothetical protein